MKFCFLMDTNLTWITGALAPAYQKANPATMSTAATHAMMHQRAFVPPPKPFS
jgi:hypothetical protein